MSISTLVSLIIFAIVVVVILGFLIQSSSMVNEDVSSNFACWLGNSIRGGGGLFYYFGSPCILQEEENVDLEKISAMTQVTWWMYHKGEKDFGITNDEFYPTYAFTVEEEITLQDLINYMATHKNGDEVDLEDSYYNYLQQGGTEHTGALCLERNTFQDLKLVPDETYYIGYYDSQSAIFLGGIFDMVIVTNNINILKSPSTSCVSIETPVVAP